MVKFPKAVTQSRNTYNDPTNDPTYFGGTPFYGARGFADKTETIDKPEHYTSHPSGIECITITEHMSFCLGNAIKYIWRVDKKGNPLENLEKAKWYIEREIARRGWHFPTPEGVSWEDFIFQITEQNVLSVSCGAIQKELGPEHLGMLDKRNGGPDRQWDFLLSIIRGNNEVYPPNERIPCADKKMKQGLVNKFTKVFNVPRSPVIWDEAIRKYKPAFRAK